MKQLVTGGLAAVAMLCAPVAAADHDRHRVRGHDSEIRYARVLNAVPVYRSVRIDHPHRSCRDEAVVYHQVRHDTAPYAGAGGALVGAIAGGIAGHQFGQGRGQDVATVAGALVGAGIGQRIAVEHAQPARHRHVRRCETGHEGRYEERIEGYDVAYRYSGRVYHTRLPYDPGDRIAIRVDVRPVRY